MTINVPEQVGVVLGELAQKLGVAAEALWSVIVRQQMVWGVVNIVWVTVCVVGVCLSVRYGLYWKRKLGPAAGEIWLGVVGGVVFGFLAINLACTAAGRLVNPAFYALSYLMNLVRYTAR